MKVKVGKGKSEDRAESLRKKGYAVKVHGGVLVAVKDGERIEEKV